MSSRSGVTGSLMRLRGEADPLYAGQGISGPAMVRCSDNVVSFGKLEAQLPIDTVLAAVASGQASAALTGKVGTLVVINDMGSRDYGSQVYTFSHVEHVCRADPEGLSLTSRIAAGEPIRATFLWALPDDLSGHLYQGEVAFAWADLFSFYHAVTVEEATMLTDAVKRSFSIECARPCSYVIRQHA